MRYFPVLLSLVLFINKLSISAFVKGAENVSPPAIEVQYETFLNVSKSGEKYARTHPQEWRVFTERIFNYNIVTKIKKDVFKVTETDSLAYNKASLETAANIWEGKYDATGEVKLISDDSVQPTLYSLDTMKQEDSTVRIQPAKGGSNSHQSVPVDSVTPSLSQGMLEAADKEVARLFSFIRLGKLSPEYYKDLSPLAIITVKLRHYLDIQLMGLKGNAAGLSSSKRPLRQYLDTEFGKQLFQPSRIMKELESMEFIIKKGYAPHPGILSHYKNLSFFDLASSNCFFSAILVDYYQKIAYPNEWSERHLFNLERLDRSPERVSAYNKAASSFLEDVKDFNEGIGEHAKIMRDNMLISMEEGNQKAAALPQGYWFQCRGGCWKRLISSKYARSDLATFFKGDSHFKELEVIKLYLWNYLDSIRYLDNHMGIFMSFSKQKRLGALENYFYYRKGFKHIDMHNGTCFRNHCFHKDVISIVENLIEINSTAFTSENKYFHNPGWEVPAGDTIISLMRNLADGLSNTIEAYGGGSTFQPISHNSGIDHRTSRNHASYSAVWRFLGSRSQVQHTPIIEAPLASLSMQIGYFLTHALERKYSFGSGPIPSLHSDWRKFLKNAKQKIYFKRGYYASKIMYYEYLAKFFAERFFHNPLATSERTDRGNREDELASDLVLWTLQQVLLWMTEGLPPGTHPMKSPMVARAKKMFFFHLLFQGPAEAQKNDTVIRLASEVALACSNKFKNTAKKYGQNNSAKSQYLNSRSASLLNLSQILYSMILTEQNLYGVIENVMQLIKYCKSEASPTSLDSIYEESGRFFPDYHCYKLKVQNWKLVREFFLASQDNKDLDQATAEYYEVVKDLNKHLSHKEFKKLISFNSKSIPAVSVAVKSLDKNVKEASCTWKNDATHKLLLMSELKKKTGFVARKAYKLRNLVKKPFVKLHKKAKAALGIGKNFLANSEVYNKANFKKIGNRNGSSRIFTQQDLERYQGNEEAEELLRIRGIPIEYFKDELLQGEILTVIPPYIMGDVQPPPKCSEDLLLRQQLLKFIREAKTEVGAHRIPSPLLYTCAEETPWLLRLIVNSAAVETHQLFVLSEPIQDEKFSGRIFLTREYARSYALHRKDDFKSCLSKDALTCVEAGINLVYHNRSARANPASLIKSGYYDELYRSQYIPRLPSHYLMKVSYAISDERLENAVILDALDNSTIMIRDKEFCLVNSGSQAAPDSTPCEARLKNLFAFESSVNTGVRIRGPVTKSNSPVSSHNIISPAYQFTRFGATSSPGKPTGLTPFRSDTSDDPAQKGNLRAFVNLCPRHRVLLS